MKPTEGHWLDRPEGGGWFALWLIRFIGLHFGRPVARVILYPVTLYFYFRRGPERRAACDYFRRIDGRPASPWRVMHLIHAFAATILDRVFLLAHGVRGFDITTRGVDELQRHLDRGQGVLLVGAHIGSFEVLRVVAAQHPQYPLKLVMDKHKTPALTSLLEALAPELADSVIDTAHGGTDIVLALSEAVDRGAMVTLLGDRGRPHEAMRQVPFLGSPAAFPVAAFQIAALLKVPVVMCLGLYRGGNRYDLVFELLAERVVLPRARRAAALDGYLARYAARLEHYLREAPCNWFNFYDFWRSTPAVAVERAVTAAPLERARAA